MNTNRARVANALVSRSLLSGVSTIGLLAAAPVMAQAGPDDGGDANADSNVVSQTDGADENVIIVTGLRESLETAAAQKRNADTVVDVVTASDIGALPDRSVSEVLQRVPGVSVLRFAGANDPDHFAVEGSGVNVRGLPFVRSELNGRDAIAASSSGVLGFEDISPELLGSVVVFKNSSADLIEGGMAGTIDLRTRLPFDQSGQVIAGSIEANYGDLRKEWSPSGSFLYSNEFDTAGGRFGILGNIAYSELLSRADGTGLVDFAETPGGLVPSGGSVRTQNFDRERLTIAGAAQYESNDGRWLATAQFLRSDSDLVWGENVIETGADSAGARTNLDSSDFTFDDEGVFTSGTITDNSQWRGPNEAAALLAGTGGSQIALDRNRSENDVTTDYGFNLKFSPNDRLRFNFDAQYIDSSTDIVDITVHRSIFAPLFIDGRSGSVPSIEYLVPAGEADNYYSDPSSYFIRSAMDHITQNEAESVAFRGDVEYDFSGDGWLKSVRGGLRYSEEEFDLRQSDFNWGNISEVWTGRTFNDGAPLLMVSGNPDPALDALTAPLFGTASFDNYQRGLPTGLEGGVPAYIGPSVLDYPGFEATFNGILDAIGGSPSGWTPLTGRGGVIEGTPFLPSEVGQIDRDNFAAYVRADFGTDEVAPVVLSGNIGLRYVRTKRSVDSSLQVNSFQQFFPNANLCDPGFTPTDPNFTIPDFCNLDLDALENALGDGFNLNRTVERNYSEFLPSLNLKLDMPNDHIIRIAISRTLTRPAVDQLNERVVVQSVTGPAIPDGNGGTINPFDGFIGGATGNANLGPQTAWNIDLAWEWYFDRAGSITVTGFHKEIDDFIAFAPVAVDIPADDTPPEFLANSLLNPLLRNTEVNSDEAASVTGLEVAYQQFYDFLPGILSGLGAQFTYTYIDSKGVDNQLDPSIPSDDPPTARFDVDAGVFPRISKHNINAVALYEKGPVQLRLAYNWRSEFQLTPRDVIFPFASIYQPATGQLDASLFVDVTDNFTVGVQAVNLADDITETTQSANEAGLQTPRNYFRNDRRYSFILRGKF